jgi:hypothetical protein
MTIYDLWFQGVLCFFVFIVIPYKEWGELIVGLWSESIGMTPKTRELRARENLERATRRHEETLLPKQREERKSAKQQAWFYDNQNNFYFFYLDEERRNAYAKEAALEQEAFYAKQAAFYDNQAS